MVSIFLLFSFCVGGLPLGGVFVISIILLASATNGDVPVQLASPQPAGIEKLRTELSLRVVVPTMEKHAP